VLARVYNWLAFIEVPASNRCAWTPCLKMQITTEHRNPVDVHPAFLATTLCSSDVNVGARVLRY